MPEPLVLISVVLVGGAYARGFRRLQARTGRRHLGRAVAFGAGLTVVAVMLSAPVEHAALERLWAHMVQHEVLVTVAAPLIILGNPLPALMWALPAGSRKAVAPWWRKLSRSHARPAGWAAWAGSAFLVQTAALWAWHAPALYEAALADAWTHWLQHLSFLGTALLFWRALLLRGERAYGAAVFYLFATSLHTGFLGVLLAFARRPLYPAQTAGAAEWGLTPLEDQQLAGLVMWVPAGLVYTAAALALAGLWIARSGSQGGRGGHHAAAAR